MKIIKRLKILVRVILLAMAFNYAQAQSQDHTDSTKKQLDKLLVSQDPADRQLLNSRLKSLAASGTESNMSLAVSYYYQAKNVRASDSVLDAEISKFPRGQEARLKRQQAITRIKSLPEMEDAYTGFLKNFPPGNYPKLPFGQDRLVYDRIRITLAEGYAKEKNVAKANYYAGLLEAGFWMGKAYSGLADVFYSNGDLGDAAVYQKKAIENASPYAKGTMGNSAIAGFAASGYGGYCATYAQILYEQKKYGKALKYIELAVQSSKRPGATLNYTYAEILAGLNRNQEAYSKIESAVKSEEATQAMAGLFKALYIKIKGSNVGLDAYEADIRKGIADNLQKKLTKIMVDEPAAGFTLTDLRGNQVSLASLKGKVVVLDFWATWCVPCKASFPAMQTVINKYKNDPDVRFLFIHTWERTETAKEDASAYMAGMGYNFQVLMDMKDPQTKANKVVDSYNVTGIPAKFVIDRKGNIRFRLNGFDGSKEEAVDEVSMAIDLAKSKG
jgi:thiol-disulfide isomerase/thioredoxin